MGRRTAWHNYPNLTTRVRAEDCARWDAATAPPGSYIVYQDGGAVYLLDRATDTVTAYGPDFGLALSAVIATTGTSRADITVGDNDGLIPMLTLPTWPADLTGWLR